MVGDRSTSTFRGRAHRPEAYTDIKRVRKVSEYKKRVKHIPAGLNGFLRSSADCQRARRDMAGLVRPRGEEENNGRDGEDTGQRAAALACHSGSGGACLYKPYSRATWTRSRTAVPSSNHHRPPSVLTHRRPPHTMVLLVTSDNEQFVVDKEVAERSVLIKNMLEGACARHGPRTRATDLVARFLQMSVRATSRSRSRTCPRVS